MSCSKTAESESLNYEGNKKSLLKEQTFLWDKLFSATILLLCNRSVDISIWRSAQDAKNFYFPNWAEFYTNNINSLELSVRHVFGTDRSLRLDPNQIK